MDDGNFSRPWVPLGGGGRGTKPAVFPHNCGVSSMYTVPDGIYILMASNGFDGQFPKHGYRSLQP